MKNAGKLTGVIIAAFSLLLVFGALMTALAETGFIATGTEPTQTPNSGKPTATLIILPTKEGSATKELSPTTEKPTAEIEKTSKPENTEKSPDTKTPTTSVTKTSEATQSGACTKPTDWKDYKVKSGDTLFAISILFQTNVATLKSGNCLTSSQIITGQIVWVPNNATLVPTKTEKPKEPTKTPKPKEPTKTPKPTAVDSCYLLTLSHLGSGADAIASPKKSAGCPIGKYKKGEKITLTAAPDPGWEVSSWYGTSNDSSTALTNTVTMPAKSHLAKPIYEPICYALSISSGANGGNPVPNKAKSTGCTAGNYIAGDTITFTAKPDTGYTVDTWTGTDSGTNILTMPFAAASVSVTYKTLPPVCFTLTLGVTAGAGSVPTASASTMGCSAGEFTAGEVITVTAAPTGAGAVDSWQTSLSYATTGNPNVIDVTMGVGDATVDVTYNP